VSEATAWPCLSACGSGSLLRVAVVPNARRTGADGLHEGTVADWLARVVGVHSS